MNNEITILPVPPVELINRWDIVGPLLDKAMPVALKRFLSVDILAMCIAGAAQGWFIREGDTILAVMISKLDVYPRRRGLSIFALAGERMDEWFDLADEVITAYAKRIGADHLELQGRRGWERKLKLEPRSVFMVKDLNPDGVGDATGVTLDGGNK